MPIQQLQEIKEEPTQTKAPKEQRYKSEIWDSFKSFTWETLKVIIISLVIIIPVRYFLIQPFYVKGASMEPSFYDHEYLIIDEISYRFSEPERGDVVVFKYPKDTSGYFIKRIIALPNERIKISDGLVTIYNPAYPQGVILSETAYLEKGQETLGAVDITLGPDEYYVLGDNRMSSLDSRRFGPLKDEYIVGKVWIRGWPLNRISKFHGVEYGF